MATTPAYNATTSANNLNLTTANYNYLMGQTGLFLGLIFCLFVLSAISQIGKGR